MNKPHPPQSVKVIRLLSQLHLCSKLSTLTRLSWSLPVSPGLTGSLPVSPGPSWSLPVSPGFSTPSHQEAGTVHFSKHLHLQQHF